MISLISNILGFISKLIIPLIAYFKGKSDAVREINEAETSTEVTSVKRILEMERRVKDLSNEQLDNILHGEFGTNDKRNPTKPS